MIKNSRKKYFLLLAAIMVLHIMLILYYGMRKSGFHEDEYYSYFTSAGYAEILPSGYYDWRSGPELQEQFVVQEEERFLFDQVIQYQVEDVHPPLYYLCLNIFMSFFPGKFFKWFSILLNAGFSIVTLSGIAFFFFQLSDEKYKEKLSLAAALLFAIAPSSISNVMFARMYTMSAMWNVIYLCVLLMVIKNIGAKKWIFGAVTFCGSVVCYLSFLTHYFSLLLPGLMTAAACVYIFLQRKNIVRILIYGLSMLAGIGCGVITYPACISHIFSGYRGTGVLGELNLNGFVGRIQFFTNMLNEYTVGNIVWLPLILLGLSFSICMILGMRYKKLFSEQEKGMYFWYISGTICCLIACLVLMKISLYVYGAGCRFFFPVLAFFFPLIGCFAIQMMIELKTRVATSKACEKKWFAVVMIVLVAAIGLPFIKGHSDNKILFLYEDEAEKVAFSEAHKEVPVVLLCDRDNMQRTWYIANQLWPFHSIFYTDYDHVMVDTFDEPTIKTAESLVVFMDAPEEVVQKLVDQNPNLENYTLIRHDPFYYVYLLE